MASMPLPWWPFKLGSSENSSTMWQLSHTRVNKFHIASLMRQFIHCISWSITSVLMNLVRFPLRSIMNVQKNITANNSDVILHGWKVGKDFLHFIFYGPVGWKLPLETKSYNWDRNAKCLMIFDIIKMENPFTAKKNADILKSLKNVKRYL